MNSADAAKAAFFKGLTCLEQQDFLNAEKYFLLTLENAPRSVPALNNLAIAQYEQKKYREAGITAKKSIEIDPSNIDSYLVLSSCQKEEGSYEEALATCELLIGIDPTAAEAHCNRAYALHKLGRYQNAIESIDRALEIQPNYPDAFLNRGNSLLGLERLEEALAAYDKALALNPGLDGAWLGRGAVFAELKRYDDALAAYDRAIAINSGSKDVWLGRGNIFFDLKRYDKALEAYDKALSIEPGLEGAWLGRGNVFFDLKRYDEALLAYAKAISIDPDLEEAWLGRGSVFADLKRYDEAFTAYDKAFSLDPDLIGVEGARLHSKMQLCNWDDFQTECDGLIKSVKNGKMNTDPFLFLAINSSVQDELRCTTSWVEKKYPPAKTPFWRGELYRHDKIRIGYVSADFRQHPVPYLMAGVFERHARTQFEITALSIGPKDSSEIRQRLERSFDRFIDVGERSTHEIATQIREAEIDILVDLNGLTQNARPDVFACRPAPVQVNYLGYPGTIAASYFDYILADPILIPAPHRDSYSEKAVYLPHSYMPHDEESRLLSDRPFERREFGLPASGFVFCCFNNAYKLNPRMLQTWMKLLKAVDGSVLWLSKSNTEIANNLKNEVSAAGVNPDRLIFAERLPSPADHLARHRLADLFLDTLPYNAHTTASDALWAGLPVLTQIGNTFAGRVAASLLNAVGLGELIVETTEQYEELAIKLAQRPNEMAAIKTKLAKNRLVMPLFNTPLFTQHLERAFVAMHERCQKGLPSDHIHITD